MVCGSTALRTYLILFYHISKYNSSPFFAPNEFSQELHPEGLKGTAIAGSPLQISLANDLVEYLLALADNYLRVNGHLRVSVLDDNIVHGYALACYQRPCLALGAGKLCCGQQVENADPARW